MNASRLLSAAGLVTIALVLLGPGCATSGEGLNAEDFLEAGSGEAATTKDGASGSDAAKKDSATSDSSTGQDASGFDSSVADSSTFDASQPDASVVDSGVVDTGTVDTGTVDSSQPCNSTTCATGCCDSQGQCHTTFTDQYCPTTNMGGGVCEDCTQSQGFCFLDIFFYVCF